MARIGVFDSGMGGLSVARALEKALPSDTIVFIDDHEHMPYGDKNPADILPLVSAKLHELIHDGCELIVIACNTVTTTLIKDLRAHFTVPLVGIEPMVKPASAQTRTGVIAMCATPTTLASDRYAYLKAEFGSDVTILEPNCSNWAAMIEHNTINEDFIAKQINDLCDQGADVIVLGCTHYHWIETMIKKVVNGRAIVMQPEPAIIARVKFLLGRT